MTEFVPPDVIESLPEFEDALRKERIDRAVRRRVLSDEVAAARGPRAKRTAETYAGIPKPRSVISEVLVAEVNLLGGPSEAGKSLLARDWMLHTAAGVAWRGHAVVEPRTCLYVMSEGTHDFDERWEAQPLWDTAKGNIFVLDEPVNLLDPGDVDWLLKEYAQERPGLVVFDVIYGMGLADDNGTKDIGPLMTQLKRISAEWGAATLSLCHNGHNGERRIRGSSMWRQLAAVEWHMADQLLSCEKSKIANKDRLRATYVTEYPALRWTSTSEVISDRATQLAAVRDDMRLHPGGSMNARAQRLAPLFGVTAKTVTNMIKALQKEDRG